MTLKKLLSLAFVVACCSVVTHAQASPQYPNDTGLALQVTYLKDTPPAYQAVSRFKTKGGTWFARFGRKPEWQLPNGAQPVSVVRLVPYLKNEKVNVSVTVLRGRFNDVEDKVSSYKMTENESVTVTQLEAFGIEPFVIKVVRPSFVPDFPVTVNLTKSVSIVGFEPEFTALPRYRLTLHNNSSKNVSALSVKVVSEGRVKLVSMPQGLYGAPFLEIGNTAHFHSSLGTKADFVSGDYQPSSLSAPQVVVESLVFEDGSFEGELKPAAEFRGFVIGRRTELRRILPLLDDAALAGQDAATACNALRVQLSALSYDADEAEVSSLAAAFPSVEKAELQSAVEVAIHGVRKDLLEQLVQAEKTEANATAFGAWLVRTRTLYANWLKRLDAMDVAQH